MEPLVIDFAHDRDCTLQTKKGRGADRDARGRRIAFARGIATGWPARDGRTYSSVVSVAFTLSAPLSKAAPAPPKRFQLRLRAGHALAPRSTRAARDNAGALALDLAVRRPLQPAADRGRCTSHSARDLRTHSSVFSVVFTLSASPSIDTPAQVGPIWLLVSLRTGGGPCKRTCEPTG